MSCRTAKVSNEKADENKKSYEDKKNDSLRKVSKLQGARVGNSFLWRIPFP